MRSLKRKIFSLIIKEQYLLNELLSQDDTIEIQNIWEKLYIKLEEQQRLLAWDMPWEHWWERCINEFEAPPTAYRTSEEENALDYLESANFAIQSGSKHKWKQVLIGLHGCTYGLCICVLSSPNPQTVFDAKNRLIDFGKALSFVRNAQKVSRGEGKHLKLSKSEKRVFHELNHNYRDQFMHFSPKGWSILLDGLPVFCLHILNPIYDLAFELGGVKDYFRQLRLVRELRDISNFLLLEHAKIFLISKRRKQIIPRGIKLARQIRHSKQRIRH